LVFPEATATVRQEEALDAAGLIDRYGDLVYRLSVRLTGDREEARDLAQEACVRIIKGATSFRGEASPKTWVCRVVVNCHRNRQRWWRRLKRGRTISLEDPSGPSPAGREIPLGETLADPAPGVDRLTSGAETRRRVEDELRRLPAEQRGAIVMREIEGMSYGAIAEAQGVAEGTVKSRIARARGALRTALADLSPRGVEP